MTLCISGSPIELEQARPASRVQWGAAFVLAFFLGVAGISRAAYLARPFHNDGGLYIYMGKTVATGGVLYRDFYENKPPGVGIFMALIWKLFGANWLAYVTLQFVMTLIAAWMLARTAGRVFGEHARRATLIFAIAFFNFCWLAFTGFQLETVQVFFSSLAACAAMEAIVGDDLRDTALAGLAAGMSAMLKPTGLAVCGAMMIGLLFRWREVGLKRIILHAIILMLCASIPNIGVAIWVIRSGLAPEMPHLFHEISLYGKETPLEWVDSFKFIQAIVFIGFPLLVRGWIFRRGENGSNPRKQRGRLEQRGRESLIWRLSPQKPASVINSKTPDPFNSHDPLNALRSNSRPIPRPQRPLVLFALSWLFFEWLGVFLQGRMYVYHFMVLFPAVALIFGMLPRRDRWEAIAASLAPVAAVSLWWSLPIVSKLPEGYQTSSVSQYISARSNPTDLVYSDTYPRLIFETGLNYGARYGTLFYFVNHDDAPAEYGKQFLEDLAHRRPKFLVVRVDHEALKQQHSSLPMLKLRPQRLASFLSTWKSVESYIATNYKPEAAMDGYVIWRRRGD